MIGVIFGCTLVVAGILFMVYMWTIVWTNGCESRYRKFRVVSYYYDDKDGKNKESHHVQWSFFPKLAWHDYITDAHYMDTAVFDTQNEALKFAHDMANQKKTKANIVIINVE